MKDKSEHANWATLEAGLTRLPQLCHELSKANEDWSTNSSRRQQAFMARQRTQLRSVHNTEEKILETIETLEGERKDLHERVTLAVMELSETHVAKTAAKSEFDRLQAALPEDAVELDVKRSSELHDLTTKARRRVTDYRNEKLAAILKKIDDKIAEASEAGLSAAGARAVLESRFYLDCRVQTSRARLEDELYSLEKMLEEHHRAQRQRAARAAADRLADWLVARTLDGLAELDELVDRALQDPDPIVLDQHRGRCWELLSTIDDLDTTTEVRIARWLSIARRLLSDDIPTAQVRELVARLPRVSEPNLRREIIETVVLESNLLDRVDDSLWPLVEVAIERRPSWAEDLVENLFAPDERTVEFHARWLAASQGTHTPTEEDVSAFVAQIPDLLQALAITWWASERHNLHVAAPYELAELWLSSQDALPPTHHIVKIMSSCRGRAKRSLSIMCLISCLGRGSLPEESTIDLGDPHYPMVSAFIRALRNDQSFEQYEGEDSATSAIEKMINVDVLHDWQSKKKSLEDYYIEVRPAPLGGLKSRNCADAWKQFIPKARQALEPLWRESNLHADSSELPAELVESVNGITEVHRYEADKERALHGDRHKMDSAASRLKDLAKVVIDARNAALDIIGAPPRAREEWLTKAIPILRELYVRAGNPDTRDEALATARGLRIYDLVSTDQLDIQLRRRFDAKIRRFTELLEIAVAGRSSLSAELERLAQDDPVLGPRVGALVTRFKEAGEKWHKTLPDTRELPSEREMFDHLLSESKGGSHLIHWRSQMSSPDRWKANAGEDVLDELAGLTDLHIAAERYVKNQYFDLASQVVGAMPEPMREERGQWIVRTRAAAYARAHEELESLILIPLDKVEAQWPANEEVELRLEIESLRTEAQGLLDALDGDQPIWKLEEPRIELELRADHLVGECERRSQRAYEDIAAKCFPGRAEWPNFDVVRVMSLVHARRYGAAYRTIAGIATEEDELRTNGDAESEAPFTISPILPPPASLDVNRLSAFARAAINSESKVQYRRDPQQVAPETASQAERMSIASDLFERNDSSWAVWLGFYMLDEAYSSVTQRSIRQAEEHAEDAARLLVHAPESKSRNFAIREALVLWLAAAQARTSSQLPSEPIEWETLRGEASEAKMESLVRSFIRRRIPDLLVEVLNETIAIGAAVALQMLLAVARLGRDLVLRLVKTAIQEAQDQRVDNFRRAATASHLLGQPSLQAILGEHFSIDFHQWGRAETEQGLLAELRGAGVPSGEAKTLVVAFRDRARAHADAKSTNKPRLSARLLTKRQFLSAEKLAVVIEVHYQRESGIDSLRNLTLLFKIVHQHLCFEGGVANVSREISVIRPGERIDLELGLEKGDAAGSSSGEIQFRVFDELNRRLELHGKRTKFVVEPTYPVEFEKMGNPYPAGSAVQNLRQIKGRDEEVEDIMNRIRGQNPDNLVVIAGARRVGKSTLLMKLSLEQRERNLYEPVHIDLEGRLSIANDTTCSLLVKLADMINEGIKHAKARAIPPPSRISSTDPSKDFKSYLDELNEALNPRRLLLLIDEFQRLLDAIENSECNGRIEYDKGVSADILGWLRNWIQFSKTSFVFAGQSREMKQQISRRENRLFALGDLKGIGALSRDAARELIKNPLGLEDGQPSIYDDVSGPAVELLLEETNRHPYLLTMLCREIWFRLRHRHRTVVTQVAVQEAINEISTDEEKFKQLMLGAERPQHRAVMWALARATMNGEWASHDDIADILRADREEVPAKEEIHAAIEWLRDELEPEVSMIRDEPNNSNRYQLSPRLLARHVARRNARRFIHSSRG